MLLLGQVFKGGLWQNPGGEFLLSYCDCHKSFSSSSKVHNGERRNTANTLLYFTHLSKKLIDLLRSSDMLSQSLCLINRVIEYLVE